MYIKYFFYFLLVLFYAAARGADLDNGKLLHDENCVRCHTSEMYTGQDRKITSFEKLIKQVHQCELMVELGWFDEEVEDVAAYLNETFYKFATSME